MRIACTNEFIFDDLKGSARRSRDRTFKVPIDNYVIGKNRNKRHLLFQISSLCSLPFSSAQKKYAHTHALDRYAV